MGPPGVLNLGSHYDVQSGHVKFFISIHQDIATPKKAFSTFSLTTADRAALQDPTVLRNLLLINLSWTLNLKHKQ